MELIEIMGSLNIYGGQGAPDITDEANIPSMELPRCKKCNGLLRPHVVWFGECLERSVVNCTDDALQGCDLLLVVGTSAVVYVSITFSTQLTCFLLPTPFIQTKLQ